MIQRVNEDNYEDLMTELFMKENKVFIVCNDKMVYDDKVRDELMLDLDIDRISLLNSKMISLFNKRLRKNKDYRLQPNSNLVYRKENGIWVIDLQNTLLN